MTTLVNVRARVSSDLNRTDLDSDIDKALNRAIEHYEKENFWFQDQSATFSTVISQPTYTSADGIPTDIKEIDYVKIRVNGNDYELIRRSFNEVEQRRVSNTSNGTPQDYAIYKENFHIYPTPNGVYSIFVYYKKKYALLVNDEDTNDWTTDAEDLIESWAEWWINLRRTKDYESAVAAKQAAATALKSLRAKTEMLHMTGEVRRNTF